jgi:hypothetical protein
VGIIRVGMQGETKQSEGGSWLILTVDHIVQTTSEYVPWTNVK